MEDWEIGGNSEGNSGGLAGDMPQRGAGQLSHFGMFHAYSSNVCKFIGSTDVFTHM